MKLCHGNFNKRLNESKTMTTSKSNKAGNNNNNSNHKSNAVNRGNKNNNTLKLTTQVSAKRSHNLIRALKDFMPQSPKAPQASLSSVCLTRVASSSQSRGRWGREARGDWLAQTGEPCTLLWKLADGQSPESCRQSCRMPHFHLRHSKNCAIFFVATSAPSPTLSSALSLSGSKTVNV